MDKLFSCSSVPYCTVVYLVSLLSNLRRAGEARWEGKARQAVSQTDRSMTGAVSVPVEVS